MATEPEVKLEIGHVLFIDIVGYSKLSLDQQRAAIELLNETVRASAQFRKSEADEQLLKLATGDGMALVFTTSPQAPAQCAVEVARGLKMRPHLIVRMGLHSGPVNGIVDVSGNANVAGAGINIAQRVMSCGDAGHILLSKRAAEDLIEFERWRPRLHELGAAKVKHGARIELVNLHDDEIGNPAVPAKLRVSHNRRWRFRAAVAAGVVILLALMAGVLVQRTRKSAAVKGISQKSIAVLPLENLTEEKENAYFADGIQDEVLSNLAKIRDLKVISRTSVMQYKTGITRNLKELAQQLGVTNVVEGSVRRSGNHIRVSVQLIDALTDRHIWAQNYDRTLADSLSLEGELATEIAAEVGATLSPQEKARLEAKPTSNTTAYDAYLRGRSFRTGTAWSENADGVIQSYQEAVNLDPNFALAWAYLSCAQSGSYWSGRDKNPAQLAAAKNSLDHAVALDPSLAETHLALGYYRYYGQRDFNGALAEFQQAKQGLPNHANILEAIILIQSRLGHWDEAIEAGRRAVELDPRNIGSAVLLAETYSFLRRYPEALTTVDRVLALDPTNEEALWTKMFAFWATGDLQAVEPLLTNPDISPFMRGVQALYQRHYGAAIEIFSKALAETPEEKKPDWLLALGLSQQRAGNSPAARATFQLALDLQRKLLTENSAQDWTVHSQLGLAYAGLGEAAAAIAEGQKAIALNPSSKDPFEGPRTEEEMAEIYALLGDADGAIPILKRLLRIPYGTEGTPITPGLLRLDPIWDPIRNDPGFQELLAGKELIGPNK